MNTQSSRNKIILARVVYISLAILCLTPLLSSPIALLLGIIYAQFFDHPYSVTNQKATKYLLQISVVGLGFGMQLDAALKAGKEGFVFTIVSIISTLILGYFLGKIFKVDKKTSYLITSGTAICGGSAIAAISPVINAEEKQISIALGTIFILNSAALFLFPAVGHWLGFSQQQFGLWSAIAIHDTSSVVGAAAKYGDEALQIATTIKLARALWIIPLAFFSMLLFKTKGVKVKIPYFIGLFVVAILLNTYFPIFQKIGPSIVLIAKAGLTLTLFLIGTSLSASKLKAVGVKPILQGLILWIFISVGTLIFILY